MFTLDNLFMVLTLLVLIQFLYSYAKDKESNRKIRVIAKSLGEIDRKTYEMEIRLNEKIKNLEKIKSGMSSAEIETLVDLASSQKLLHIEQTLAQIDQELKAFEEEFASRIIQVESTIKQVSIPQSSVGGADDRKIIQLHQEGKDIESIAKELRISNAEVEFALKLADLR